MITDLPLIAHTAFGLPPSALCALVALVASERVGWPWSLSKEVRPAIEAYGYTYADSALRVLLTRRLAERRSVGIKGAYEWRATKAGTALVARFGVGERARAA